MKCFFCDNQDKKIIDSEHYFSMYDEFPVSEGHALIVPKEHKESFFSLEHVDELFEVLQKTKEVVQARFNPGGFNVGVNEGKAAGQTLLHAHVHVIPRYAGDVENPKGGVRNILPEKADYTAEAMKTARKVYLE